MMNKTKMAAPFKVGQRVKYVGKVTAWHGQLGTVVENHDGYDAHIHDFGDGPEEVGPQHSWSVVQFDKAGLPSRVVTREPDLFSQWEVVG